MGFNPFKAVGKAVKGITKPFKKILRSPLGKIAGLAALYYGAPMMGGYGAGGAGWKKMLTAKAPWLYAEGVPGVANPGADPTGILTKALGFAKKHPYITAGGTAMAAGALGDDVLEESKTVIDTSGHEGYLNSRKMFVDEWTDWLIEQGHDEETARAMAEKELFAKAEGGLIGLAQGGRIGYDMGGDISDRAEMYYNYIQEMKSMGIEPVSVEEFNKMLDAMREQNAQGGRIGMQYGGGNPNEDRNREAVAMAAKDAWSGGAGDGKVDVGFQEALRKQKIASDLKTQQQDTNYGQFFRPPPLVEKPTIGMRINDFRNKSYQSGLNRNKVLAMRKMNLLSPAASNIWGALIQGLGGQVPEWAENLTEDQLIAMASDIQGIKDYGQATYNPNLNPAKKGSGVELLGRVTEGQDILDRNNMTQADWDRLFPGPTPTQGGEGRGAQPEWQRLGYPSYDAWLAAQSGVGGTRTGETTGDYYGFKEWEDWAGGPTTPLFDDTTKYKALLNRGGRIGLYGGGMGGMNNPMNPMMNRGLGAMGSPGMNPFNQQNLMAQGQMRGNPMMGRGNPMMGQRPGIPAQGAGISGTTAAARMAKKEDDGELLKLIRMLASMGIPMEQLRGRTKDELVEMAIAIRSKDQAAGRPEVVEESEEVEEEEVVEAAGGGLMRTRYAMGSEQPVIPSKDGPQLDFRDIGGYQPHGKKEKHDDVRALLAQGEFVVTSDAVKGIGGGDRDLGAKRMYDMMHKYEPIGKALS